MRYCREDDQVKGIVVGQIWGQVFRSHRLEVREERSEHGRVHDCEDGRHEDQKVKPGWIRAEKLAETFDHVQFHEVVRSQHPVLAIDSA